MITNSYKTSLFKPCKYISGSIRYLISRHIEFVNCAMFNPCMISYWSMETWYLKEKKMSSLEEMKVFIINQFNKIISNSIGVCFVSKFSKNEILVWVDAKMKRKATVRKICTRLVLFWSHHFHFSMFRVASPRLGQSYDCPMLVP